jgi:two-component system NtrC family sensor kinase
MPSKSSARPQMLIVALVLAAAVVAFAGLSFSRKAQTFQPLGFEGVDRGAFWQVTSVEILDSFLQSGDQILLINGQEYGGLTDPASLLRRHGTSELVVLREGEMVAVTYALPSLVVDFSYLILSLIGVGYLLIGIYTLLRDGRRPAFLFFLWCVASAVLYIASPTPPYDWAGRIIFVLDQLARILVAPLTLHLFAVFPRPASTNTRVTRAIPFFYLPSVFLIALQIDLLFFDGRWLFDGSVGSAIGLLDRLELYHMVIFALAASTILWLRLSRISQPEPHRQATWIAVGMTAGYVPFLTLYVLPLTLGLQWHQGVTAFSVLFLAFVPITFAYAILRYKLWDIGAIVRDTVTLGLTVLVGVVGFSIANMMVNRLVPDDLSTARTLLSFASGLVIAGLLVPTKGSIGASLERLQYRGTFGKRRALAKLGQQMLEEHSLGRLCSSLLDDLQAALEIDQVSLFLSNNQDLLPFRPQRDLPPRLEQQDFDDHFWTSEVEALSGVEFPTESLSPQQQLFAAGYRYVFPLRVRENKIGILLAGYKQGELPLSSDDLDLIRAVVNQASLALENAKLLEQLTTRAEEVGRLQRYTERIIQSSPAAIAVLETTGKLHLINQAFAALLNRDIEDLEGMQLGELLPIEPLPKPEDGILEVSFRDDSGEERYLQVSVAPFEEADSDELQVLILQDVSQRVAMENALKEKERLASLGMLAAGVAHEVNTPLTGISSYAQMLLAETPEGDPRRELLEKVEKQTFRAASIVNNLLDFSRDRSGEQRPLLIAPFLHESLVLLKERILAKNIRLDWSQPEDEVRVQGNGAELQQVFTNLVINAVDAMEDGGQLRVHVEADDRWVWISVEDDGPGIPIAELEKIFQPFYSTKLATGGTGLGLSISYNIIRRHQGEIRVMSHPGEGSRFIVELPRLAEAREESE